MLLLLDNEIKINESLEAVLSKLYPNIDSTNDFNEIHNTIIDYLEKNNYSVDGFIYLIIKRKNIEDIKTLLDKNKCFYDFYPETNDTDNVIRTTALEYRKMIYRMTIGHKDSEDKDSEDIKELLSSVGIVFFNKLLSAVQAYSPYSNLPDTEFNRENRKFRSRLEYEDVDKIRNQYLHVGSSVEYLIDVFISAIERKLEYIKTESTPNAGYSAAWFSLGVLLEGMFRNENFTKDDENVISFDLTGYVKSYPEKFNHFKKLIIENKNILDEVFYFKLMITKYTNEDLVLKITR